MPLNRNSRPLPDPERYGRVLIIRLGALGDVIRTLPVLRSLRLGLPDAEIHWLVEDRFQGILEGHTDLDNILVLPRQALSAELAAPLRLHRGIRRLISLVGTLRRHRYDAVFDFHGLLKSGLLARSTGSPVRIGFSRALSREGSHLFLTHPIPLPVTILNRIDRMMHVIGEAGIRPHPEEGFGITIPPEAREEADSFLEQLGIAAEKTDNRRPFAVFHPGTSRMQAYKRWPAERYADLADRLIEQRSLDVVLAWGPGERGLAEEVVAGVRHAAQIHLAPALPLKSLAALCARCALFVGGDTGPMHLAAAMGSPVVCIFGPTNPELNRPLAPGGFRPVHPGLDFEPSGKRNRDHLDSIGRIGVDRVFEAVVDLMENGGNG